MTPPPRQMAANANSKSPGQAYVEKEIEKSDQDAKEIVQALAGTGTTFIDLRGHVVDGAAAATASATIYPGGGAPAPLPPGLMQLLAGLAAARADTVARTARALDAKKAASPGLIVAKK